MPFLRKHGLLPAANTPIIIKVVAGMPMTCLGTGMWVEVSVPYVDMLLDNPPVRSPGLKDRLALGLLLRMVWAGTAYAQSQTPGAPGFPYGMMGAGGYGPMHAYMVQAFAEALNLTPEEVSSRIDAGECPS